jgi:pseudomonalisin
MRRLAAITGALALAAGLPLFGSQHPTYAATTWVNTGTGAEAPALVSASNLSPLAGSTPLRITVALPIQNKSGLDAYIRAANTPNTSTFGQKLTPAQFTASYGATSSQVSAVVSYLQSQGMTNVQATPNNLLVTANATAAQADAAFNTTIDQFSQNGQTLYANTTAAQVPSTLSGDVAAVLGLTNAGRMSTPHLSATSYLQSYNPQDFQRIYNGVSVATGSATAIAIFAEGALSGVVKDLRTEETANNLPQVPVSVVQTGIASPDTAGADEWDMDTQYSTGIAQTVSQLYIYDATSLTDSDLALSFSRFATDNLAKAGSASFGECEYQAYLDGSMVADDQLFAEAAAQGQTVFASSGDTGGFCPVAPNNGVPAGVPDVNYPTSSPYVVSVGGTTLFTNGTPSQNGGPSSVSYDSEIAWFAGGGGPSAFEFQPYWQNGVTPPTNLSCLQVVACLGKNLPDIAMDADPNSGANVYVGGQPTGVGGTSLSSPLALGSWARIESAHSNQIGFAAPNLYRTCALPHEGFTDIILGNTGPYEATHGWDFATGCGSINIADLNRTIVPPTVPPPVYNLASPACTVLHGDVGDAQPLGSNGNVDSLDILAAGFQATPGAVTAQLLVKSLSSGPGGTPQLAGDGDNWYVTWNYGGIEYFLQAQFPISGPDPSNPTSLFSFSYGTVGKSPTGGTFYTTVGNATGTVDTAKGVITMSAPASVFGNPASGATLSKPGAATFESVGTPAGGLLEAADADGPGTDYVLGTSC